jgi:ABC transporter substrate binding protein
VRANTAQDALKLAESLERNEDAEIRFIDTPSDGQVGMDMLRVLAKEEEHRDQIAALAKRYSVPTMFQFLEYTAAGGLMSYGPSFGESYRQAGIFTGRILRGEKPADLPVKQSTKFELVINIKTAKALGIDVPISMQMLADEVIE